MRYLTIPSDVTTPLSLQPDGTPGRFSFADYLDAFVSVWGGWRTSPALRSEAIELQRKFAGEVHTEFEEKDGRRVVKSVLHILQPGLVVELTDKQHEALCTAVDQCAIPPALIQPFMPFAVAVHGASTTDPRPKDVVVTLAEASA